MPTKSKYSHIRLSQSRRQVLNISRFGGVDLSSQKFNVSSGRAIDSKNFYYKDGVLQVRQGYEELYDVLPIEFVKRNFDGTQDNKLTINSTNFNGIWQFEAEDGERHIVAHIGYLLFEILNFGTKDIAFRPLSNDNSLGSVVVGGQTIQRPLYYAYEDYRSSAFVGAKKLWFLGGNKYMLIRFTNSGLIVEPVEESDETFIPKTSTGITYTNAKVQSRANLDYPNMLTMYRRNMLVSGIGKDENTMVDTPYFEYELDAPLLIPNAVNGEVLPQSVLNEISKIKVIIKNRGKI